MNKIQRAPTEKEVFLWNTLSSAANAALSVFVLVAVTRLTDSVSSDIFSLGWAVASLMLVIGCFQVRLYQSTDAAEKYSFQQYLRHRGVTIAAMAVVSAGYVLFCGYTGTKAAVILLLCGYRAVDALSDVYQGWFQHKERLDLAGKALFARVVVAFAVFTSALLLTHNLVAACVAMDIAALICFFVFDLRYTRDSGVSFGQAGREETGWFRSLTIQCLPLFLNYFLTMVIFNTPKLAIERAIEEGGLLAGAQTVYSILFMPSFCINVIYLVFRHIVTKMAIAREAGDMGLYRKHFYTILLSLAGLSAVICLGGWLLGIPVLQWVYSVDLAGQRPAFMILLAGGCLNAFVYAFDNALTVIRKQYWLLPVYGAAAVVMVFLSPAMVRSNGLHGAAVSFLISQGILLALVAGLYLFLIRKEKGSEREKSHEP